jgi:hypothetical protein
MNPPEMKGKEKGVRKDLPPPHWSPTGNSGVWEWRNESWCWTDDEQLLPPPTKKYQKNFLTKMKNLITIWKETAGH